MTEHIKLFDKIMMFSDIHFGLRNNSKDHNDDCLSFIKWMIEEAKKDGITEAVFLGDYFHNRSAINVSTLNYGLDGLELINDYFTKTYFIVGNHDMFFKHKRDITSVKFASHFSNIQLVSQIEDTGSCLFVPFLVGDEWELLKEKTPKYIFGHFELPGYKLNSLVEMPDHGKEQDYMFKCDALYSGHFHKRQMRSTDNGSKIVYIGNCFPHNFSDAWDDARGCVSLDWDGNTKFHNWGNAPKFRTALISDILEDPNYYLGLKVTMKAQLDIDLTVEEMMFIKETYMSFYKMKDFNIVPVKGTADDYCSDDQTEIHAESVDSVVIDQINNIESKTLRKSLLLEIYNNL